MFKNLFTEAAKYYKVWYDGDSEGYIVFKAKNYEEAEKLFNKEKKNIFKKTSNIKFDGATETKDDFEISLVFNESKTSVMKYKRADGKEIAIPYEIRYNKAFFKVPARDVNDKYSKTEMSDEIVVAKGKFEKDFNAELAIFNWLKSINY